MSKKKELQKKQEELETEVSRVKLPRKTFIKSFTVFPLQELSILTLKTFDFEIPSTIPDCKNSIRNNDFHVPILPCKTPCKNVFKSLFISP